MLPAPHCQSRHRQDEILGQAVRGRRGLKGCPGPSLEPHPMPCTKTCAIFGLLQIGAGPLEERFWLRMRREELGRCWQGASPMSVVPPAPSLEPMLPAQRNAGLCLAFSHAVFWALSFPRFFSLFSSCFSPLPSCVLRRAAPWWAESSPAGGTAAAWARLREQPGFGASPLGRSPS